MGSAGHHLAARRIRAVQSMCSGVCGEAKEQPSSRDTMYMYFQLSTDWLEPELSELSASF